MLYEKDQTEWTKEEILDHIRESGPFTSFKLNRISGIVAEVLDQIQDRSGFRIELIGQSTPEIQPLDQPNVQVIDPNTPLITQDLSVTRVIDYNTPEPQNMGRNPLVTGAINAQTTSTKTYGKELANLAKLYTDEAKYNSENDNFDFKLIIFMDLC
jgi:hypothetical protein